MGTTDGDDDKRGQGYPIDPRADEDHLFGSHEYA